MQPYTGGSPTKANQNWCTAGLSRLFAVPLRSQVQVGNPLLFKHIAAVHKVFIRLVVGGCTAACSCVLPLHPAAVMWPN